MTPYDGGPTISTQQPHNGVGPPPIPRPPPPPGVGLGSPSVSADHSRHRQPPHMGMPPGPLRQQSSNMNYPLPMQLPPSPNMGGPNGGPPGPPYHHPHHPGQQRHYSQQRHQQSVVPPHPSHHGPQHGAPTHHPPQHSSQHHSHPTHPSQSSHHSHSHNPSHHPPQHHVNHSGPHHSTSQHAPHHSQHHRSHPSQHPPPGPHGPNSQIGNPGPPPISPRQHSMPHSGHSQQQHPSMRSKPPSHQHSQQQQQLHSSMMQPPGIDHKEVSHSALNGDWQSDQDLESRREMIKQIVKLLKQRDKNVSPEWLSKLPQMVKQLEVSLYRSASSFQEYSDTSTLKSRLQQLAIQIAKTTQQSKDQGSLSSATTQKRRNGSNGSSQSRSLPNGSHSQSSQYHHQGHQQHDAFRRPAQGQDHMMGRRKHEMNARRTRPGGDKRQVSLSDINPMMSSSSSNYNSSNTDQGSRSGGGDSRYKDLMSSGNEHFTDLRVDSPSPLQSSLSSLNDSKSSNNAPYINSSIGNQPGSSGMINLNGSSSSQHKSRNDEHIKHKQQRLLLLHHSYKCTAEKGKCKVSSYCDNMKRLWKHIGRCKDPRCQVPHCFSSRSILSHYKECKDSKCPICLPVRESVRRQSSSSKSPSFSRERVQNSQPSQHPYSSHPQSSSSERRNYANGFGADSPSSLFVQSDPSTYHKSHISGSNSGDRSHAPAPLGYRSDPQSPPRISPSNGYQSKHMPLPGKQRSHPQPTQPGRSSYKPSSDANKIKHKAQRLLLLRHASKCRYENEPCPVTEHCASMKRLWRHIGKCKDQFCKEQHCISSRYVLTHYRDCTDPQCQACLPVRESIKKSNERKNKERNKKARSMIGNQGYRFIGEEKPFSFCEEVNDPPMPPQSQPPKRVKLDISDSGGFAPPPSSQTPRRTSSSKADKAVADIVSSKSAPIKENQHDDMNRNTNGLKEQKNQFPLVKKTSDTSSKNVDIPSLMNCFSIEQIETHIKSLNRTHQLSPSDLKKRCLEVLKGLQSHPHAWVFANPVDPVELNLHDYFQIIKHPMDLGTIQKRIENGLYHSVEEFAADTNLTFDNATTYNQEGSVVHGMAVEMKAKFVADYDKLLTKLKDEEEQRRKNDRACSLCGCEKLLFEPPVFFCNGVNCQSKRIRRNSHFHVAGNNQYFWCNPCYNELDEKTQIELGDMTIKKSDLKKRKNDEVHEESWVQCDDCEKWIHQICGLFNARQNKELKSVYCCPECTIKKRKAEKESGKNRIEPKAPMAVDLPRTKLSERLEKHVRQKVEEKCVELARDKSLSDKCTIEDALKSMNLGGPVTIRQVTSTDRKLEVRERMKKRYAHKKYPEEFTFRCKCINVFQNLDGVDVLLFALYVYEHNEKNPPPNQRTVYISYLDSVHFMRPRKIRTLVYHEILICYLNYAREKGFRTAHIWACPPLKGDDYIFYAKPEDQKTPKDARLRQWYVDMLVECQKQGIVGKLTNMFDLYFKDKNLDATAVPYLEGDYFAGEVENVIKDLEEGNDGRNGTGTKKTKKKRGSAAKNNSNKPKVKSKSSRGGTRSGNAEEETKTVDAITIKNGKDGERDAVMAKLGDIIQPMKASFIVAFLNWSGAEKEDMLVPKEIQQEIEKRKQESKENDKLETVQITSRKRDAGGNIRDVNVEEVLRRKIFFGTNFSNNTLSSKIIDDDLEDMDCEFFNNRQSFLDLCRGNHYQFDELRRAKHTSMMVLWHLHNRDAPKFVQQCAACNSEILTGYRHTCSICTDYDLCDSCFKNPNTNRGTCTHELKAIPVERSQEGQGTSAEIEEQRRQTQRNIQLHLRLLDHASVCNSQKCHSRTCAKMKGFLKHTVQCKLRVTGGCKICKRLWTLLRYHAQQCKNAQCPIPMCKDIRVRIRQMQNQQQAMDDRRRQEMNRACRNENR